MALNWVPPFNGTFKINVHKIAFAAPMPNDNITGMGIVLRTSDDNMVTCIARVILGLSLLVTQLWAIFIGLRRAFIRKSIFSDRGNRQHGGIWCSPVRAPSPTPRTRRSHPPNSNKNQGS